MESHFKLQNSGTVTTPTQLSSGVLSPGLASGLLDHDFPLHLFSDTQLTADLTKLSSTTTTPTKFGRGGAISVKGSLRPSPIPISSDHLHGNLDFHLDGNLGDIHFDETEFAMNLGHHLHGSDVVVPSAMNAFDDHHHFPTDSGMLLDSIHLDHFDGGFPNQFGNVMYQSTGYSNNHGGSGFGNNHSSHSNHTINGGADTSTSQFPHSDQFHHTGQFNMGTTDGSTKGNARGSKNKNIRATNTQQKKRRGSNTKVGSNSSQSSTSSKSSPSDAITMKRSGDAINSQSKTSPKKRQRNKQNGVSPKHKLTQPTKSSGAVGSKSFQNNFAGSQDSYYNAALNPKGGMLPLGHTSKAPRLSVDPSLPVTYSGIAPSSNRSTASAMSRMSTPGSKSKQTSYFRGVSCCGKDRKWQARIRDANRVRYLGRYPTEVEAAFVYDRAARECKGATAPTNFVVLDPDMMDKLKAAFIEHGEIPPSLHDLLAKGMRGRVENAMKKIKQAQAAAAAAHGASDNSYKSRPNNSIGSMKPSSALATPSIVKGNQHFFPATPRPQPSTKRAVVHANTATKYSTSAVGMGIMVQEGNQATKLTTNPSMAMLQSDSSSSITTTTTDGNSVLKNSPGHLSRKLETSSHLTSTPHKDHGTSLSVSNNTTASLSSQIGKSTSPTSSAC